MRNAAPHTWDDLLWSCGRLPPEFENGTGLKIAMSSHSQTSTNLAKNRVFDHNGSFHSIKDRVFVGETEAFRTLAEQNGWEPTPEGDLLTGVKVTQTKEGTVRFAKFLKVGMVEPPALKCEDFWKDTESSMTFQIKKFDVGIFPCIPNCMSTAWIKLPFKVEQKSETGDIIKIKEQDYSSKGIRGLTVRMFFTPKAPEGGDWILVGLPVDVSDLDKLKGNPRDEGYPGIKILSGKFKMSAPEEPFHKYGLGIIPLLEVEGLTLNEDNTLDIRDVQWIDSISLKRATADLLANVSAPNWHRKARTLKEAVDRAKWNRVPLSDDHVWPPPREEDDQARSEEEDAGDVSGRGSETGTRSNPPGNFK